MTNLPTNNSRIIFSRVPAGSYASVGVVYLATHNGKGGDVHLINVATGSGTFDRPTMYARAAWSYAPAA